jgi:hypothetical protein
MNLRKNIFSLKTFGQQNLLTNGNENIRLNRPKMPPFLPSEMLERDDDKEAEGKSFFRTPKGNS